MNVSMQKKLLEMPFNSAEIVHSSSLLTLPDSYAHIATQSLLFYSGLNHITKELISSPPFIHLHS